MAEDKKTIVKMAYIYTQEGKWEKAIAEYKKLLAMDPSDFNVHSMLGDVYVKKNSVKEAYDEYIVAADAYSKQGLADKASVVNKKIAKIDPGSLDAVGKKKQTIIIRTVEAESAMEKNDLDGAIAAYQNVIELNPDSFEIYHRLGDLFSQKGMIPEAVKNYVEIANAYFTNKIFKKAAPIFQKIIELDPKNLTAHGALGEIFAKDGNESEAKKEFLLIAEQMLAENELEKALAYSQKAIQLKSIEAYYLLGQVQFRKGLLDEAKSEFEKLLRFKVNHVGAMAHMGEIHLRKEKLDDALNAFNKVIKLDPNSAWGNAGLATIYAKKKKMPEALNYSLAAARLYLAEKDKVKAEENARRAQVLDPESVEAGNLLGEIAELAGGPGLEETATASSAPSTPAPVAQTTVAHTPVAPAPVAAPPPVAVTPPQVTAAPASKAPEAPQIQAPVPARPAAEPGPAPVASSIAAAGEDLEIRDDRETLMRLANDHVSNGALDEAIELFQRILAQAPDDVEARDALHKVYALIAKQSAGEMVGMQGLTGDSAGLAAEFAKLRVVDQNKQEEARKAEEAAKKAGEEAAAKKAAEEAARKIAEEKAKRAAEDAAKKVAEDGAKKAAEDAAKRAAEDGAKKAAEDVAKKAMEDAAKKAAEDVAKKAAEDAAKKAAEDSMKKVGEEPLVQAAPASGGKLSALESAKRAALEAAKRVAERNEAKKNAAAVPASSSPASGKPASGPAAVPVSLASKDQEVADEGDEFTTITVAEMFTKQGLFDEAIKIYQRILQREPANQEAKTRMEALRNRQDAHKGAPRAATPAPASAAPAAAPKPAAAIPPAMPVKKPETKPAGEDTTVKAKPAARGKVSYL